MRSSSAETLKLVQMRPVSHSFFTRKTALKWLCLEARREGKTDTFFGCFLFKIFDTSLPQEGGTRTDMQNQQIGTQMSDLAFCQFDMTHRQYFN